MISDPVEYILDKKNYSSEKEDAFFDLLDKQDIYIHVEDKGKEAMYELLFEKLYPNTNIQVYANYDGKAHLLKNYYEKKELNKIRNKDYYLLDRDYEVFNPDKIYKSLNNHSFTTINSESQIIILKKTNIENYFLDPISFKKAFKIVSGFPNKDLNNFIDVYNRIIKIVKKISKYYLLNTYLEKDLKKLIIQYINFKDFKITPFFYTSIKKIIKEMEDNGERIEKSLLKELKHKMDLEKDLDGKEAHIALTYACKNFRSKYNSPIKNENILRAQISNLPEAKILELKRDLNFI